MAERIRVSGFRRPVDRPMHRRRSGPVPLIRPFNMIGLVGAAGILMATLLWGTPHILLFTRGTAFGASRFTTDCAYVGLDGRMLHLRGEACPLFRLLKPRTPEMTMPRTDDPTLTVPNASADFRRASPEVFARAQGDLDTTRRLGAIEIRAEAIKQRFYDHFERHEDAWVAAEALNLAKTRDYPTLQHPAPRGFGSQPRRGPDIAELMATKARQTVHARAIQRLSTINSIKNNLQNALIRNRPQLSQARDRMPANDPPQKQSLRNTGA